MSIVNSMASMTRVKASLIHLSISMAVAACAATLVFGLWYPFPYRSSSGGRDLFFLVTGVDVVLGPLITLAVFNVKKGRRELLLDLSVVAAAQVAALFYGLWVVSMARPVYLAFEFDRFRVVHAIEVPNELLETTAKKYRSLPIAGPKMIAVRPFASAKEESEATLMALQGVPLSARPDLWEDYQTAQERVLNASRPISELRSRYQRDALLIDHQVKALGIDESRLRYLPMAERTSAWTVLITTDAAEVVGYIPLDSF